MAATTSTCSKGDNTKLFIAEVNGSAAAARKSTQPATASASTIVPVRPNASKEDANSSDGVRACEHTTAAIAQAAITMSGPGAVTDDSKTINGGGSEVFRIIDNMAEKQQRSRHIRSMIQKAAQKTVLVVRAKNATQAAENATVRFHKLHVTDTPRSVQLQLVCNNVLRHAQFHSKKQQHLFYDLFAPTAADADTSRATATTTVVGGHAEVDALLKDMFWYLTAHCFQRGQHVQTEQLFYERIADSFTSLFIRLQMRPQTRDVGFLDVLPDMVAQILFAALYDAFPKSRSAMLLDSDTRDANDSKDDRTDSANAFDGDLRREILRVCYCWFLGFVPGDLHWDHWIPVDEEAPKRIAALAAFPAMRNRLLRAERVERTKLDVKYRHVDTIATGDTTANDERARDAAADATSNTTKLPCLPPNSNHSEHATPPAKTAKTAAALVQTRERCVYEMRNSPLVTAFLRRHQLDANATHLRVQLRLTNGSHLNLQHQAALHATHLPRGRRRRVVDSKAYSDVLQHIERFSATVRATYATEKQRVQMHDATEKQQLRTAERSLALQLGDLAQHSDRLHAFSNVLVSKRRVEAVLPSASVAVAAGMREQTVGRKPLQIATSSSSSSESSRTFTPRPPPPRQ